MRSVLYIFLLVFSMHSYGKEIVTLGDVHGDLESVLKLMKGIGLVDSKGDWIARDKILVQVGDLIDRGSYDREVFDFFEKIKIQAKDYRSEVHLLLGNHEINNSLMIFKDIPNSSYESFTDFYTGLDDLSKACIKNLKKNNEIKLKNLSIGQIGRAQAFCPGGAYAKLLSKKNLFLILEDTLFVHGGLHPSYSKLERSGLEGLEKELQLWLLGAKFNSRFFEDFEKDFFRDDNNPLETRVFSKKMNKKECKKLDKVLKDLKVKRMVVAHTVQDGGINSACDDKVIRIDTGYSLGYHNHIQGKIQALSLINDKMSVITID